MSYIARTFILSAPLHTVAVMSVHFNIHHLQNTEVCRERGLNGLNEPPFEVQFLNMASYVAVRYSLTTYNLTKYKYTQENILCCVKAIPLLKIILYHCMWCVLDYIGSLLQGVNVEYTYVYSWLRNQHKSVKIIKFKLHLRAVGT